MLNYQAFLVVATGGALGSVARFLVGVWSTRAFGLEWPWGTLIINVSGSFLLGVFIESFALHWDAPPNMRLFWTVGICGGFTTFSTFSLDTCVLLERGEHLAAAAYILASVAVSIGGLFAAMRLLRLL